MVAASGAFRAHPRLALLPHSHFPNANRRSPQPHPTAAIKNGGKKVGKPHHSSPHSVWFPALLPAKQINCTNPMINSSVSPEQWCCPLYHQQKLHMSQALRSKRHLKRHQERKVFTHPMTAEMAGGELLFFSSRTFTTWGTFFRVDSVKHVLTTFNKERD